MITTFTDLADRFTEAVGRKARDYRGAVHSAFRVYALQGRVKGMLEAGGDLGACIAELLPNAADPGRTAARLLEGVGALRRELQADEPDWRAWINRALADKTDDARARYLINLIRTFVNCYPDESAIAAERIARFTSLVDADEYTQEDIRFLTDLFGEMQEAHSDFAARAYVRVTQRSMDKLSPAVIEKIRTAYELDAVSRAAAFYVAQQTGELRGFNGVPADEIPPEMLGQLAAAQTESSRLLFAHWQFGVAAETLKADVKHVVSAMLRAIADNIEDWARFALSKTMLAGFVAFLLFCLDVTPLSVIFVGLAVVCFRFDLDFDEMADALIESIKEVVDMLRDAVAGLFALFNAEDATEAVEARYAAWEADGAIIVEDDGEDETEEAEESAFI